MSLRALQKLKINANSEYGRLKSAIVGHSAGFRLCDPQYDPFWKRFLDFEPVAQPKVLGEPYPDWLIDGNNASLDNLAAVLESEGVNVYRADLSGVAQSASTGMKGHSARDCMACIGDKLLITPGVFRSRRSEADECYSHVLADIEDKDSIVDLRPFSDISTGDHFINHDPGARYVINESVPLFDAANILCFNNKRVIYQLSSTGNVKGMNLLQSTLGDDYELIPATVYDSIHIDSTIAILNEELILYCAERADLSTVKKMFSDYGYKNDSNFMAVTAEDMNDVGVALNQLSSIYVGMNFLSIDKETVVLEGSQSVLAAKLRAKGFRVLLAPMPYMRDFAGGVHCATLHLERED